MWDELLANERAGVPRIRVWTPLRMHCLSSTCNAPSWPAQQQCHLPTHSPARSVVSLPSRDAGALVVHLHNDGHVGAADEPGTGGWKLLFPPAAGELVIRKSDDDPSSAPASSRRCSTMA